MSSAANSDVAVPDVVVGPAFAYAWQHRQNRLFSVKSLDLNLSIDAEYECTGGRR